MKLLNVLFLLIFSSSLGAADSGLVLQSIETPRDVRVRFTETRMNELLKEPLGFSGALLYGSDGTLAKFIDEPVVETVIISPSQLTLERDGRTRTLPLRKARGLAEFYAGLRYLLDGDLPRLRELFSIRDTAVGELWEVELTPRDESLQQFAATITVSGDGDQLTEIFIARSDAEWERLALDVESLE